MTRSMSCSAEFRFWASLTDVILHSMFWDYLGSNPESLYQVMRLFSDLGTPYGFRHMHAWTGHTYRCVVRTLR